jgi:hypothetical protein
VKITDCSVQGGATGKGGTGRDSDLYDDNLSIIKREKIELPLKGMPDSGRAHNLLLLSAKWNLQVNHRIDTLKIHIFVTRQRR